MQELPILRPAREDDYPLVGAALRDWWQLPGFDAASARERSASIAFHRAMGFAIEPGTVGEGEVRAKADYDGPGVHRVVFARGLAGTDGADGR